MIANFLPVEVVSPERAWCLPFIDPPGLSAEWVKDARMETANGAAWKHRRNGLVVLASGAVELDDKRWIHVSFSRKDRMPSYDDTCLIKRVFIGEERKAIQVFPPRSEHFNLHKYCLHLWHCLDGDGLPDFRDRTGGV